MLYNLNISIIPVIAMQWLDQCVGPVLLCAKKTPRSLYPSTETSRSLILQMNCVLLSEFDGLYTNCKNIQGMSNINFAF